MFSKTPTRYATPFLRPTMPTPVAASDAFVFVVAALSRVDKVSPVRAVVWTWSVLLVPKKAAVRVWPSPVMESSAAGEHPDPVARHARIPLYRTRTARVFE